MRNFQKPGRSAVFSENGMCATSHPLAAQSAINILQQGGNAMDAAIAGAVLLGFCEPQMTGLGGDCFVLFSPAGSDDIKALNGSGHAPHSAAEQPASLVREFIEPRHQAPAAPTSSLSTRIRAVVQLELD